MIEITLAELTPGEEAEVVAVEGGAGFRARLRALGLVEGQRVRNVSRIGWGGPVILLVNRAQIAIGRGMARKILVRTERDE